VGSGENSAVVVVVVGPVAEKSIGGKSGLY